jgi:hypothetical protein
MTPPDPIDNKKPVSILSRKKAVMAIVILLAIVIISVIAVVVLFQSPAGSGATLSPASSATTSPAVVENSLGPAVPQPVRETDMLPADNSPVKPVDFVIDAGSQEKCGLTCRQLTPSITNTGNMTAHNVCISLVLSNSGGDLIPLNGAPTFRKCIGNIASGESKSEPIVIDADCGFLASKCIRQTLILKTKATCDETTVQFPDQIIAV